MEKVERQLKQLDASAVYVIGVSGGPDSMALLDMMVKLSFKPIVALVNYHKREDSNLDYEVVKQYCEDHQLILEYREVWQYTKENFQAQARTIRYEFFVELVKLYHAKGIILAHHADDCVETILMQKARHAKVSYWGIAPISQYHGILVYRPCLDVFKDELAQYCAQKHIPYRIDSSNLENHYTRNYFRNVVLKEADHQEKWSIIKQAQKDNMNEKKQREMWQEQLKLEMKDGVWMIDLNHDQATLSALLDCFLREDKRLDPRRISSSLVQEGIHMLQGKSTSQMNLPGGYLLKKEKNQVYIEKKKDKLSYTYRLENPQCLKTPYFTVQFEGSDREGIPVRLEDFPLTIRTIQPGDTMTLSYGTKKVSRLFIDAKIPREKRQVWPIVCDCHGKILLVPKIAKNKDYLMENASLFVVQ